MANSDHVAIVRNGKDAVQEWNTSARYDMLLRRRQSPVGDVRTRGRIRPFH